MTPDIVPDEVLVPPEAHGGRFDHHEGAVLIDGYLRRLASQNARCRAIFGRLARCFVARNAHHDLGFARLDDYGRERLSRRAKYGAWPP